MVMHFFGLTLAIPNRRSCRLTKLDNRLDACVIAVLRSSPIGGMDVLPAKFARRQSRS